MLPKILVIILALGAFAPARDKEKFGKPAPIELTRDGERWAEKTLKKMSLEEKVGQIIQVRVLTDFMNVNDPYFVQLKDQIRRFHLGSIIMTVRAQGAMLWRSQPYEAAMLMNALQREAKLPLIVAADFERGVYMRLNGATGFPHAMAFGAANRQDFAERFGEVTALESRALGIHWNYFPVSDVNSNPANPIINTRSFGEDPQLVGDLNTAYIRGARKHGMLTTAKHFPGHGDTSTDTHIDFATVNGDQARLESVELTPFRTAIQAGVDSVMIAHVTVPALEPDPAKVATVSYNIVTKLLKEKMGFQGLVVTDALEMRGLADLYSKYGAEASGRAAVDSIKAGNDLVILPLDTEAAYHGLLKAVRSGEITEERLNESVRKLLRAKASLGLHKARLVDIEKVAEEVSKPENLAFAQEVADAAVTLVRDNGKVLPLPRAAAPQNSGTPGIDGTYETTQATQKKVVALVMTDDARSEGGRVFERALRLRAPQATVFYLDPRNAAGTSQVVWDAVQQADTVIAALYVIPSAGRRVSTTANFSQPVPIAEAPAVLLRGVLDRAAEKTVVIAMGNPYLVTSYPDVQTYLCTFSNAPVSETSAVKALFGEAPINGRLPVTLPGIANRGAGLDRPVVSAASR